MAFPANSSAATVLLAGPDAAAVESLRPAAELLESFGVGTGTAVVAVGPLETSGFEGRCAGIVASPDGALPAAIASATAAPVIRVPVEGAHRSGLALLDDGHDQLPGGDATGAFATMAIGAAGAKNAALFVVAALALRDERLRAAYADYRARQTAAVLHHPPLEA